jgi:hypothetical protein
MGHLATAPPLRLRFLDLDLDLDLANFWTDLRS